MKTNAFVRQLASNKRTVRENALATLKKFLSTKSKADKLSITELEKLWKGLFYTMWFCDKPRPQQRLANDLAKLYSECIVDEQFCSLVESFWTIMVKEWRELDKWRLDKFLMLMRYVIRECFVKLDTKEWDEKEVSQYLSVLKKVVLKDDSRVPRAITYHVIDVWVDEIERVLFASEDDDEDDDEDEEDGDKEKKTIEEKIQERKDILEEKKVPVGLLLEPFKELCGKGHFEALVKKIRLEILDDERLLELGIDTSLPKQKKAGTPEDEEDDEEDEEEEEWKGFGV